MTMKQTTKERAIFAIAIVAFSVGMMLAIWGFFFPPKGEISGSVLTFTGEVFSFVGAIFGISGYTGVQIRRIDHESERVRNKVD